MNNVKAFVVFLLLISPNVFAQWVKGNNTGIVSENIYQLKFFENGSGIVISEKGIWKSTNDGDNWEEKLNFEEALGAFQVEKGSIQIVDSNFLAIPMTKSPNTGDCLMCIDAYLAELDLNDQKLYLSHLGEYTGAPKPVFRDRLNKYLIASCQLLKFDPKSKVFREINNSVSAGRDYMQCVRLNFLVDEEERMFIYISDENFGAGKNTNYIYTSSNGGKVWNNLYKVDEKGYFEKLLIERDSAIAFGLDGTGKLRISESVKSSKSVGTKWNTIKIGNIQVDQFKYSHLFSVSEGVLVIDNGTNPAMYIFNGSKKPLKKVEVPATALLYSFVNSTLGYTVDKDGYLWKYK